MALDGGFVGVDDAFNLDTPVMVGSHKIGDYKGKGGVLSVPEIMMYSSNIGTAQIAMKVGAKNQREYLKELGLLAPLDIEIPERGSPIYPHTKLWSQASMITISFGHGIAVTPLHAARAVAAVVNDGKLVKPTLIKRDGDEEVPFHKVIGDQASSMVRKVMRLVVTHGSGKKANVEGYFLGGKTGTAEKLTNGRYNKKANVSSFISAFPMYDPQYVMVIIIDEAKPGPQNNYVTAGGAMAAPVAGRVIPRIAPLLGITPRDENDQEVISKLALSFNPRRGPLQ
jgi:cell division protein FtsI (penicillin-binding protein 3)